MENRLSKPLNSKSIDSYYLKWIAIISMVVDHCTWVFVPTNSVLGCILHTIGKITGPVMFFFIAEGYHHTHNLKKYMLRLFIFSIISYFPYSFAMNNGHGFGLNLSVISTLLVALIALTAYDKIENVILKIFVIIGLVAITFCMDWPFFGVLITLAFGIFYGNRKKQLTAYVVVALTKFVYMYTISDFNLYYALPFLISPIFICLLLSRYNGERRGGKFSKWFFYVFYPAHFILIGIAYLIVYGFNW